MYHCFLPAWLGHVQRCNALVTRWAGLIVDRRHAGCPSLGNHAHRSGVGRQLLATKALPTRRVVAYANKPCELRVRCYGTCIDLLGKGQRFLGSCQHCQHQGSTLDRQACIGIGRQSMRGYMCILSRGWWGYRHPRLDSCRGWCRVRLACRCDAEGPC